MAKIPKMKLTADNKLLMPRNGNSHFANAFRAAVATNAGKEAGRGWSQRIKPSGLRFDMCIEQYQNTCHIPANFALKTRLKFVYGNAFHKFIGQFMIDHYPDLYKAPTNLNSHAQKWYQHSKPEVPIVSDRFRTKALMDFPAIIQKRLIINDWKTTWETPENWTKFLEKPRIKDEYICQGASYCYLSEEEQIFDITPEGFSFTYINLKEDPEDRDMWCEIYFDYAPYRKATADLWALLIEAVEAKIKGGFVLCANDYCPTHGRSNTRSIGSTIDPWSPIVPVEAREASHEFVRSNVFVDRARGAFSEIRQAASALGIDGEEPLWKDDGI